MKQAAFESQFEADWQHFALLLEANARRSRKAIAQSIDDREFAAHYRRICLHLALAERRGYSVQLNTRLRDLVHRGHWQFYRATPMNLRAALHFFAAEFPRLVRRHAAAMWIASALFFIPLIGLIVALQLRPEWVHHFVDAEQLMQYEAMYQSDDGSDRLGREGGGSDLMMFGFYVMNNISIGFRTFASGLLVGIGPIFVLVFNAQAIGAIAGHLTAVGLGDTFWRFVVGHSAPELIAIALAGGAGLQLGFALIAPGARTRMRALRDAGIDGGKLAFGIFALLLIAAAIEAFFSAQAWIPDLLRFGFGLGLWLLIPAWLILGGRRAA
jgi:uncharacterized membrane protein SpoIIM required for sporulation